MEASSTTSDAPIVEERERRVRLRFRDRSEISLAIKYLIFAFNVLIWVNHILVVRSVCLCLSFVNLLLLILLNQHFLCTFDSVLLVLITYLVTYLCS